MGVGDLRAALLLLVVVAEGEGFRCGGGGGAEEFCCIMNMTINHSDRFYQGLYKELGFWEMHHLSGV